MQLFCGRRMNFAQKKTRIKKLAYKAAKKKAKQLTIVINVRVNDHKFPFIRSREEKNKAKK